MLTAVEEQTFCPYKGLCSYYDIAGARRAAWSYLDAWPEVRRVADLRPGPPPASPKSTIASWFCISVPAARPG